MRPFAVFDIETTALDDFGHLLAVTVAEVGCVDEVKPKTFTLADYPGTTLYDDRNLLIAALKELDNYACLVGWYSKGFDAKFLRRRALAHKLRPWAPQLHLDLYYTYKCNFKTGYMSCRLAAASEFLELPEPKMVITRKIWKGAWYGEGDAMEKIKARCESDVKITAQVFDILLPYVKSTSFKAN